MVRQAKQAATYPPVLVSYLPFLPTLYMQNNSPLCTGKVNARTIYYELRISANRSEVSLSLGFTAHSYPTSRLSRWGKLFKYSELA